MELRYIDNVIAHRAAKGKAPNLQVVAAREAKAKEVEAARARAAKRAAKTK
jgi:hypothetical protein